MSDTPLPLPAGLRWIKLVCRLGRLAHDGTDPDDKPDLLPTAGKVRLASSPARLRVQEADGRWRSVSLDDREYTIRADGELVDTEGRVGVWFPDPASELLDPRPYTLVATVNPTVGGHWAAKITGENLPDVVDLVAHSETVAVPASAVPGLSSRIASVEGILADGGTGTGSGIRNVSGAVTLDATPGIYEVYALAAATVNGVSLAAGDAAVFRYLSGWSWMIVGQHTTWQAPEPISVAATAPTFTDADGTANDRYIIPAKTGVEYRKGGTPIAAGTYTPTAGESVTITAVALDGYALTGTTSWSKTFSTATTPISVTPVAPTFDDTADTYTIPAVAGVDYYVAGVKQTAGVKAYSDTDTDVTVTAQAQPGYTLTGTASWTLNFTKKAVAPGPITDTFDGAAGPLTGHTTTTGGMTWENYAPNPGFNLTGDGKAVPSNTAALSGNTLPTSSNIAEVSVDYSERSGRFGVYLGTYATLGMSLAANGEVICAVNDKNVMTAQAWKTGASGTLKFRYDGTTVTFWHDGVQMATKTGVTIPVGPLRICTDAAGGATKIDSVTFTPIA